MTTTRDYAVFDPRRYLHEYYADTPHENLELLRFLVDSFSHAPADSLMLDFGCGPTIFSAIAAAANTPSARIREIHMSEYLPANRDEVALWLKADPAAFDWSATIRASLLMDDPAALERSTPLHAPPDVDDSAAAAHIAARATLIRQRVTQLLACDVLQLNPLHDQNALARYDVLVSNLCLEAAARDEKEWERCIRRVASLVRPAGQLIFSSAKRASAYAVADQAFAVLPIDEDDMYFALLDAGFRDDSIEISSVSASHPVYPYDGLMFTRAVKADRGSLHGQTSRGNRHHRSNGDLRT